MELNKLITILKAAPDQDMHIAAGFGNPHSWRGSYDELAFEPVYDTTIAKMLAAAKEARGTTYPGYKGGDFTMTGKTDVHIEFPGDWSNGETLWNLLFMNMLHK